MITCNHRVTVDTYLGGGRWSHRQLDIVDAVFEPTDDVSVYKLVEFKFNTGGAAPSVRCMPKVLRDGDIEYTHINDNLYFKGLH